MEYSVKDGKSAGHSKKREVATENVDIEEGAKVGKSRKIQESRNFSK
jgi:hypothetical protein